MDDVNFSTSAESDLREPGCSVRGWGTQVEEGMLTVPVCEETRSCLGKMRISTGVQKGCGAQRTEPLR